MKKSLLIAGVVTGAIAAWVGLLIGGMAYFGELAGPVWCLVGLFGGVAAILEVQRRHG